MELKNLVDSHAMHYWKDIITFEELMQTLKTGTRYTSFGSDEKAPILSDTHYFVGIEQYFTEHDVWGDVDILSRKELEDLNNGFHEWSYQGGDNSYNYAGNIERPLNIHIFKDAVTEKELVLYSVHVGLDVRAGYTKPIAVLYENEYARLEHMITRFTVASGSIVYPDSMEQTNDTFFVSSEAFGEMQDLYIQQTGETYEAFFDGYDKDYLKESIENMFKEELDMEVEILID